MNLNPVEWAKAQEFLLKLVQILGPYANQGILQQGAMFALPRNFFIPPSGEIARFKFDARLLITLQDAKKEVDDWIEKLPEIQEDSQSSNLISSQKDKTSPLVAKGKRNEEEPALIKAGESDPAQTKLKNEAIPNASAALLSKENEPKVKTAAYAQKVVDQVRQAIQTLSSSSYLTDPQAEPLKGELRRLKPLIEQLIDVVTQEKPTFSNEAGDLLSSARFKTFPSEREERLKKLMSFSLNKRETFLRHSFTDPYLSQEINEPKRKTGKTTSSETTPGTLKEEKVFPPIKDPINLKASWAAPMMDKREFRAGEKAEEKILSSEQKSLLAGPFTSPSQSSSNSSSRKNKKKRKSFWFRDEEEPEKRS